jgi:hypothetical protein
MTLWVPFLAPKTFPKPGKDLLLSEIEGQRKVCLKLLSVTATKTEGSLEGRGLGSADESLWYQITTRNIFREGAEGRGGKWSQQCMHI